MNSIKNIFSVFIASFIIVFIFVGSDGLSRLSQGKNDDCFACHEDKDLTMEKDGKKVSLFVNPESYKKSVHSANECNDCHQNYNPDELPHSLSKQSVDCKSCHQNVKDVSVHDKVECSGCHSKHEVKPVKELSKNLSQSCSTCHNNKNVLHYNSSIHAKKNIGCDGCHLNGHGIKKITKQEVTSLCGKCHGVHEKNYKNSIHQTVFNKGNKIAPVCTDCHGTHQIFRNKISVETEACLKCHLDEKKFPGDNQGSAKFVLSYKTSVHAAIEKDGLLEAAGCVDCHGNHIIQNLDNPKSSTSRAKLMETCGKCHKKVVENFKNSKHGQELAKGNEKAPTCTDCHGEHDIKATLLSNDFSKINLVDKCLSCHKDGKIPHKDYKGEEELITGYQKSAHYKELKKGNQNAPTCYECHGAHQMEIADNPNSKIYKKNISQTCGQTNCHVGQLREYMGSIHQAGISEDNKDAPTCNNCHGNHTILTKDNDNKLEKSRELIQLCSNCHASVELVKRNDLPTMVSETYLESFHGLATRGGLKEAANCESCHGYHNVRPSKDSLSTIHKNNLPETCGNCHPGATEVLFSSKIHLNDMETDSPWLFWITRIYIVLIVSIVGFMLVHNILDLRRKLFSKKG